MKNQQSRRDERTRRLVNASAHVQMMLKMMPRYMDCVEFHSRLVPPLTESENRETFKRFVDAVDELQDSADAFLCFCDCKYHRDDST